MCLIIIKDIIKSILSVKNQKLKDNRNNYLKKFIWEYIDIVIRIDILKVE